MIVLGGQNFVSENIYFTAELKNNRCLMSDNIALTSRT